MAVLVTDDRAGGAHLVDLDADEIGEVAARAAVLLEHLDPALGGDHGRVHVVDGLLGAALEGAVERGDGEQARVVPGERAVVRERDSLGAAFGELHREAAELRGQRDERAEQLEVLRADRRDVDRVRDDRSL